MWVLFAVLSAAASATLASPLLASEMQTRGRAAAEVDAEEGEELEVQSESPLSFGACPFEVRWEVLQLHHTKMTALAHVSDTSKVVPLMRFRMHAQQPVVLSAVYHATAPDTIENVGSTDIDFAIPDANPWLGGGDAHDALVIHLDFPAHVKDLAHLEFPPPSFTCLVRCTHDTLICASACRLSFELGRRATLHAPLCVLCPLVCRPHDNVAITCTYRVCPFTLVFLVIDTKPARECPASGSRQAQGCQTLRRTLLSTVTPL